jgi:hypothetical protein
MTVNAREFLVFVAIVTSAIVLQLRQHTFDENSVDIRAQPTRERSLCNPAVSALGNGRLRASCEPAEDVRGVKGTTKTRIRLWV